MWITQSTATDPDSQGQRGDRVTLSWMSLCVWLVRQCPHLDWFRGWRHRWGPQRSSPPPTHTAFPLLKQPYILICNICAGRAFQNGCSLEDDGRVCSNLGLGHLVLQGSAQMLAFTMSLCPLLRYPGRSILGEVWCVFFLSSLRPRYL